jgi:hypothetical protein
MTCLSFDDAYREKMIQVLRKHDTELERTRATVETKTANRTQHPNLGDVFGQLRKASADLVSVCEYYETRDERLPLDLTSVILRTATNIAECNRSLIMYSAALILSQPESHPGV